MRRDVASYFLNLHKGFDALGIKSKLCAEIDHRFYTSQKKAPFFDRVILSINNVIFNKTKDSIIKVALIVFLYPFVWFCKIIQFPIFLARYDVFIYTANYSYLGGNVDKWVIKKCGKKIVHMSTGSDVRAPFLNGAFQKLSIRKISTLTKSKYKIVQSRAKYGDFLIDYPTVTHFSHEKYIPHMAVGFPMHITTKQINSGIRRRPLILHAPSSPEIKGTVIIRNVIEDLKKEFDFDYEELLGVPNEIVLQKLQECSFVINQLYSDALMSGLDAEAAWFGKPSITGGYNLDMVVKTVSPEFIPPTYRIKPDESELKKAIIHLLTDKQYCKGLGSQAQEFVQNKWNAKSVAQRYLDMIEGRLSREYFCNPEDDLDIYGCGLSIEKRNEIVGSLIQRYGESALCLNDKPKVRDALLRDCGLI